MAMRSAASCCTSGARAWPRSAISCRASCGGGGLAREAVGAVIAHGFGAMGLRRIFGDADPENAASIGTLAALGFMLEGRLREEWETHIGVRDSLIFGLLRHEWTPPPADVAARS